MQREIATIFLQGEWPRIQKLVINDRGVEQGGRIIRLRAQRRIELLVSVLVTSALHLGQAQFIPGLGRTRVELERLAKAFFRSLELTGTHLGGAQFDPAVGRIRLQASVTGQSRQGGGNIVLLEVEAPEIVVGGGEVAIQRQGLVIRFDRLLEPPSAVVSEAEMVPGPRLPEEQARS